MPWSQVGNITGPVGMPGPDGPTAFSGDLDSALVRGSDNLAFARPIKLRAPARSGGTYIVPVVASGVVPKGDGWTEGDLVVRTATDSLVHVVLFGAVENNSTSGWINLRPFLASVVLPAINPNTDFEGDPSDWTNYWAEGHWDTSVESGWDGNAFRLLAKPGMTGTHARLQSNTVNPVKPGDILTFTAQVEQRGAAGSSRARMGYHFAPTGENPDFYADFAAFIEEPTSTRVIGAMQEISWQFTVPDTVVAKNGQTVVPGMVRPCLTVTQDAVSSDVWVDNYTVTNNADTNVERLDTDYTGQSFQNVRLQTSLAPWGLFRTYGPAEFSVGIEYTRHSSAGDLALVDLQMISVVAPLDTIESRVEGVTLDPQLLRERLY